MYEPTASHGDPYSSRNGTVPVPRVRQGLVAEAVSYKAPRGTLSDRNLGNLPGTQLTPRHAHVRAQRQDTYFPRGSRFRTGLDLLCCANGHISDRARLAAGTDGNREQKQGAMGVGSQLARPYITPAT